MSYQNQYKQSKLSVVQKHAGLAALGVHTQKSNFHVLKRVNEFSCLDQWHLILASPGARPTKHISIEFEIRWQFKTL